MNYKHLAIVLGVISLFSIILAFKAPKEKIVYKETYTQQTLLNEAYLNQIAYSKTCQLCNGKGYVTCKTCSGTGNNYDITHYCNGSITIYEYTCYTCNGTGYIKCPKCKGVGMLSYTNRDILNK